MISQDIRQRGYYERRGGSVTVEASISLVLFIFAMVSVLSVINICRLQRRIGNALNRTALDISRYSYFYYVTGGYDAARNVKSAAAATLHGLADRDSDGTALATLAELTNALFGGDPDGSEEAYDGSGNASYGSAEDQISLLLSLLSESIADRISGLAAGHFVRAVFHCNLGLPDTETDKYLRSHGVVGGWNGLSFDKSRLFPDRSPRDIDLEVSYKVKIPFLAGLSLPVTQRAVTGAWLGGDRTIGTGEGEYTLEDYYNGNCTESIWKLPAFDRGKLFKEVYTREYRDLGVVEGMRSVIGYDPSTGTYHNCVSINTFSESYNDDGFQAAKACEHSIRKLRLTISELGDRLDEGERAYVSYTVIIPEDASDEVHDSIDRYLTKKIGEFQGKYPFVEISFRIVRSGGNANT